MPSINALLSNPEYSKLSDEDKAHARLGWFDANVASSPNFLSVIWTHSTLISFRNPAKSGIIKLRRSVVKWYH